MIIIRYFLVRVGFSFSVAASFYEGTYINSLSECSSSISTLKKNTVQIGAKKGILHGRCGNRTHDLLNANEA